MEYHGQTGGHSVTNRPEPSLNAGQQIAGEEFYPRPSPHTKMRPIEIRPLDFGYAVTVGCQTLAIETKEQLIAKLTAYIINPAETEEKFLSGKLF